MNSPRITKRLVALITGASAALGQTLLLSWLFPGTVAVYELRILQALLVLNYSVAVLVLFFLRVN